jgi:nucleotide-binding universal stress UspA family protein
VVGIDGSASALTAARWGAVEARRRAAPLRLVTAVRWTHDAVAEVPGLGGRGGGPREHVADALAAVEEIVEGHPVDTSVVVGDPVGTLAGEAGRARLLVLGSRGLGGSTGVLVGSVAVALSVRAACPVVVVRGADGSGSGPVVVGVDDSPSSEAAITFAFEAAAARGVPLVPVRAWLEHAYDAGAGVLIDWTRVEERQRSALDRRLARWAEEFPAVRVSPVVARDGAARTLVEHSRDAQLVVVGSRGRGNLAGLAMGSVSHVVLQHAHCPVAVVRPQSR